MIKRLSAIAAVFFLLAAFLTPAFAGTPFDATTAINDAKQSYSDYYKDYSNYVPKEEQDNSIHYITSTGLSNLTGGGGYSYGFLTYGQAHGDPPRDGQQRYIGYTYYGEDYTNMDYPADQNANGADFASQKWTIRPWKPSALAEIKANSDPKFTRFPGDGSPEYRLQMQAGILAFGGTNAANGYTLTGFKQGTELYDNIERYIHIESPPTAYSWGIGRLWHYKNGSLMYVTVPIMPKVLLPDLATNLETDSFTGVEPGQKITSTVAYRLSADHPKPERARVQMFHEVDGVDYPMPLVPVNGAPVPDANGYITLSPGDTKIYQYTFTVQPENTKIVSAINPVDTGQDRNWANNKAEAGVMPQGYDIKVKIVPDRVSYTVVRGGQTHIGFTVYYTRKDNIPGTVVVNVTQTYKDQPNTFKVQIKPGETISYPDDFIATPGNYTISAEAWPDGADAYPPDNQDSVTVTVNNEVLKFDKDIHVELLDGGPEYN